MPAQLSILSLIKPVLPHYDYCHSYHHCHGPTTSSSTSSSSAWARLQPQQRCSSGPTGETTSTMWGPPHVRHSYPAWPSPPPLSFLPMACTRSTDPGRLPHTGVPSLAALQEQVILPSPSLAHPRPPPLSGWQETATCSPVPAPPSGASPRSTARARCST